MKSLLDSSSSVVPTFWQQQLMTITLFPLLMLLITLGMPSSQASENPVQQAEGFAALEQMDLQALEQARAREGQMIVNFNSVQSVQKMKATVTGTSFDVGGDMTSGNISFAPDALGNYNGTGIFSAVTGNGNSINNAVGISVFISN